jgi:hypothetical protein
MLKRLFLQLPLFLLFFLTVSSIVIPVLYWVITGKDYIDLLYKIEDI